MIILNINRRISKYDEMQRRIQQNYQGNGKKLSIQNVKKTIYFLTIGFFR